MTEAERYVRDRVSATGKPCLIAPQGGAPSLRACLMSEEFMDGAEGVYILLGPWSPPRSWEEFLGTWESETVVAFTTLRRWVPEPPEGVRYAEAEAALGVFNHVEASALGLSLLQLALNRSGSGIAIEARP